MPPLPFLRAMKRRREGLRRLRQPPVLRRSARDAEHAAAAGIHGNAPTAITLGNINLLIREVTRLYGNKRIWITEYGYQTNPPDRIFGVSFLNQARYLTQAYGIAKEESADRHVPLVPPPRRAPGREPGLAVRPAHRHGGEEPSFAAFQKLR